MVSNLFPRLDALARNLRWAWHPDSQRLFAALDPALFSATNHNPLKTMRLLRPERREALLHDPHFERHLGRCENELRQYLGAKTWFDRLAPAATRGAEPRVGARAKR